MASGSLTTSSSLQCAHGGTVQISSSNSTVKAAGTALATAADTFTISGCSFTIPPGTPSPCSQVMWMMPDTSTKIGGTPTLSESSTGCCLAATGVPQGPVSIVTTQSAVQTG